MPPASDHVALVYRALRDLPRYNRFVVTATETPLSLIEAAALVEIATDSSIRAKDLVQLFGVDKVSMSRALTRLKDRRLLSVEKSEADAREQALSVTKQGWSELEAFDASSNDRLERYEEWVGLGSSQRAVLCRLLTTIADGLGAAPASPRPVDHQLRPAIRRITRALGLLGPKVFSTELTSLQWQIVLELHETGKAPLSPALLAQRLRVPVSSVLDAVKALSERGFIRRVKEGEGRRALHLWIDRGGSSLVRSVERDGCRRIGEALHTFRGDINAFNLLDRWIAGAACQYLLGDDGFVCRPVESDSDLQAARRLTVGFYTAHDGFEIPEMLFSPRSSTIGLEAEGRLVAAAEIVERRTVVNFCWLPDALSVDQLLAFLLTVSSRVGGAVRIPGWAALEPLIFPKGVQVNSRLAGLVRETAAA